MNKTPDPQREARGQVGPVADADSAAPGLEPSHGDANREAWLWANGAVLESVLRGLDDAAAGRVHNEGSFADLTDNLSAADVGET